MPHCFIHGAATAGRLLAGMFGCLCLYAALFMYEDEEGQVQSRVESFWISVHDRAKLTDSTTISLFNKIAEWLVMSMDKIFGTKIFSMRTIVVSTNISLVIALLVFSLIYTSSGWWTFDIYFIPMLLACSFFLYAAIRWKNRLTLVSGFAPLIFMLGKCIQSSFMDTGNVQNPYPWMYGTIEAVLLISFVSDILALAIVRSIFRLLSVSLSPIKIVLMICALGMSSYLLGPGSALILVMLTMNAKNGWIHNMGDFGAQVLLALNAPTTLYCIVPGIALMVVLLHRVLWPTLSRALYPIAARRVFTDRKVMISAGTAAIAVALNLEHLGWKLILDHLK